MMNKFKQMTLKRTFWTLAEGKSIGFIESIYKAGIIFPTDFITFRETSSNISSGDIHKFSISKLSIDDRKQLERSMYNKTPVCVDFSNHLIGSPLKGVIEYPSYMNKCVNLDEEKINIKNI